MSPPPLVQLAELDGLTQFSHEAMATSFSLHLAPTPNVDLRAVAEEAFRLIDQLEDLLSFYREGSDLTRINRAATGEIVRIHEITHRCLLTALEVAAASEGAFNPFAGGAALIAKNQPIPSHLRDRSPPSEGDEAAVIAINHEETQVTKLDGSRWLDLGAIGKGAALDAVAELLHEWEVPTAVLVGGGSSVLVYGHAPSTDQPLWPLIIPLDPIPAKISVTAPFALGASGLGFQAHHIIGKTHALIRPQSVVLAPSAAVADALSTAALLLADEPLRELIGEDPAFSVLATHASKPAVQTGIFQDLKLSQIQATLVIPCWCESSRISSFLSELVQTVTDEKLPVEIIVVDDGSPLPEPEKLHHLIESLRLKHRSLHPLIKATHQGKGGAIYRGWRKAAPSSQWLGFVDADGAVPAAEVIRGLKRVLVPEYVPRILAATRYHRDSTRTVHRGFIRQRSGGWFSGWAQRQLNLEAIDSQCGFKIVPAKWWRAHPKTWREIGYAFDLELLIAARDDGIAVENFPISWTEIGGSSVTWRDGLNLIKTVKRLRTDFPENKRRILSSETEL